MRVTVHVHPASAPENVINAWRAALGDAGIGIREVALIWRPGRPRPTGQQSASFPPATCIDPEWDDDHEFVQMLTWANGDPIRGLRRVMIWVERTPEGLAGLLRHELEHTIQIAAHGELYLLHQRAYEELAKRGATGNSYNAIPMEVDANRAAARFLRALYGTRRLEERIEAGDLDAACFRPRLEPEPLNTLVDRMSAFILTVMDDAAFIHRLEMGPAPE